MPVYGKLADMFGRKPIMLFGIGLFLLGSILCGFAWSMPALIAFRARAGPGRRRRAADEHDHRRRHLHPRRAGEGAGLPGQRVGDLRGGRARPWAGCSREYLTWRWIFFVNIPLCVLAAWMLIRRFHESVSRVRHRIDYLGQHHA